VRDATSIVVGIDGSEPSNRALSFSTGFAARTHARLVACFVSHQPTVVAVAAIVIDFEQFAKELEYTVNEELERCGVVNGLFYHRQGDTVTELKRLAEEQIADLIVVGRSRHPHLHVGSVPRRLLDTAHLVLIVP
jgi:nucleotide-binding universal stress UspA family protein